MNEISPLGNSQAPEEVESNLQPHNIEAEPVSYTHLTLPTN